MSNETNKHPEKKEEPKIKASKKQEKPKAEAEKKPRAETEAKTDGESKAKAVSDSPKKGPKKVLDSSDILIEVEHLTKTYGDFAAVDDISFQVKRGEVVGFLGPNGAGKTTTMRMLTCLLAPTSGRARVAGHDTLTESMDVRRAIGYLPEDTPLYENMSVLEFLRFAAEARDVPKSQRAARIKDAVDVSGLTSMVGRAIGHLSKGYRQRVGLAQAMVHDPPILILDEPWTGLDPNQIADVRGLIKKLGENKTLLLSTHILAEVEAVCDRVIIIDHGKIKADGSPEQVVREHGVVSYDVTIKEAKDAKAYQDLLQANADVAKVSSHKDATTTMVHIECRKGADVGQEFVLESARKAGLVVSSIERSSSNLEDVFRSLTVGDKVEIGKAA